MDSTASSGFLVKRKRKGLMDILSLQRKDVEEELKRLLQEEEKLDLELEQHFATLKRGSSNGLSAAAFELSSVQSELKKVENAVPMIESLQQNAKKLSGQVDDCRTLSDRLSSLVR